MIKRILFIAALGLCLSAAASERVLLVVSSAGTAEDPESGYEFDELTQAWWTFVDNGYEVEIASPAGGEPQSEEQNPMWAHNTRFLEDAQAMAAIANTVPLAEVSAADYDAVFLIGGSGAAIDLPQDPHLQALVEAVYGSGGVIGAVCHGPAGLVNAELAGRPFLEGRHLTAFTNAEEALFGDKEGKGWSLEDRIVEEGGRFDAGGIMHLHVVEDGRLVTGQNPFSTALTAEATIRAMGGEPRSRTPYRNETTMALAKLAVEEGLDVAAERLAASPEDSEPMFLALLGFYQSRAAGDEAALRDALILMQLSAPYFQHDNVTLAMASAHEQLGELDAARGVLTALLERSPESEAAREQLAALGN
ncbi:DJ-1/PfpI family protein [Wenzhouxiangella marina]|uniref:Thiazole biosynthesis protein ThiJ n=1 Tax=Wenzhouxiangella marina TaxID=1579979 RepID=A0A0K0XYK3_9GAMM|nr:DJ-1/PfpI family protein [Wenzhouxiangella marina]AKS42701.1 Thiazole biosynthesis protein ThiJ [Wenzhouxiangella marina]MBB6088610.1 putative intracellular protease/amidase [Wenzhouxiangella marina]